MKLPTRIRASRKNGKTIVAVLIRNKDIRDQGVITPGGYLARIKLNTGDGCLAEIFSGAQSATDPLIKFEVEDMAAGTEIDVSWSDNQGCHGDARAIVS